MADTDNKALLQPEEGGEKESVEEKTVTADPSDKLTPDHPRFKDVLARAKEAEERVELERKEKDELKSRIEELESKQRGSDELTPDEVAALDRIDRGLRQKGFVTKEELDEKERILNRNQSYQTLSTKYSGNNGYPKFDPEDVTAYAKSKGYGENFEAAYFDMHKEAIIKVEAKKLTGTPETPNSEKPTGGERTVPQSDLTPEQISQMSDTEWEKHREKILAGIKGTSGSPR